MHALKPPLRYPGLDPMPLHHRVHEKNLKYRSQLAPYAFPLASSAAVWMDTARPDGSEETPQSLLGILIVSSNTLAAFRRTHHFLTVEITAGSGKLCWNNSRIQYASLVSGVCSGNLSARFSKSSSETTCAACSFMPSIQE